MASQRATLPGDMNSKVDSVDLVEADGEPQSPLAPLTPRVIPDNVLITLSALHAPESFPYPERRIHLDRINKSVKIGRTSKRVEELAADVKNGWFDSPVMSRDHAEIFVDWFYSKVYIKDIGSLHGTFRNQDKVKPGFPQALAPGDILKFGVDIQRASDLFPPCTTRVDIEFGTQGERPSENQTPTVFQVPDDTDSDRDTSSEEEDDNIRTSLEILRRSGIRRAPRAWVSTKDFVDLTQALPEEEVFDNGADTTLAEPEITAVEAVLPSSTPAGVENPWVRSFVDYGENFPSLDLTPPHDVEVAEEEEETTTSNFGQLEPRGFDASEELISNCDRLSLHDDEHFSMDSYPDDDDEISDASHEQSDLSSGYEDSDAIRLSESVSSDDDEDSESEEEGEDRSRDNSYLGIHNTEGSIAGEEPSGAPYVDDWNNEEITTFNQVESMAGKEPPTCQTTPDQPANSHEPVPQPWTENSSFASRDDACRLGSILNPWVVMPPYRPPVTEGPFACPATYQGQPAPMLSAVAGDMGEKTGKYDFFAARAANKATVGHQKQRGPLPPISEISPPLPPSPFTNMASTVKPLDATIKSQPSTETKTANNQTATESAWSASGDKFLNSPPEEPLNSTEQSTSPELDMGSAYLFQKSKIAAETQNSSDTDTTEATNVIDSVIPSKGKSSEPQTGQPRKRKAEEISTVDANEEIKDKDEGKCGQISKRNRGVAQSLGYFALGGAAAGVAFLSTLIATAPTLT